MPTLGALIGTIFDFINYTWIRVLPTEFFYICGNFWYSILGGNAVYYLGKYRGGTVSKLLNGGSKYWGGEKIKMIRYFTFLGWILGKVGKILQIWGGGAPPPPGSTDPELV